jgi:hypothetical protein
MSIYTKIENFKKTGVSIHFNTNDFKEFIRNVDKSNWSDFHSWIAEQIMKEYISGSDKTEFVTWFEVTMESNISNDGTGFDTWENPKVAFINQVGFEFNEMQNNGTCEYGKRMFKRFRNWMKKTGNDEWMQRRNKEREEWIKNN